MRRTRGLSSRSRRRCCFTKRRYTGSHMMHKVYDYLRPSSLATLLVRADLGIFHVISRSRSIPTLVTIALMKLLAANGASTSDHLLHPSSIGCSLPVQIAQYIRHGVCEAFFQGEASINPTNQCTVKPVPDTDPLD